MTTSTRRRHPNRVSEEFAVSGAAQGRGQEPRRAHFDAVPLGACLRARLTCFIIRFLKRPQVAGLTRGAVYWHFKGKAELFLEVRKDVFAPLIENVDLTLCSERYTDPLDAIEASLKVIYCTLENSSTVRQVYEIMLLRCEHVDEFSEVLLEVSRPAIDFLEKMTIAYQKARAIGTLGQNLDPIAAAQDTHAFVFGLLHLALAGGFTQEFRSQALAMISGHIALRRQR